MSVLVALASGERQVRNTKPHSRVDGAGVLSVSRSHTLNFGVNRVRQGFVGRNWFP